MKDSTQTTHEEIDDVVRLIMRQDGPDGHTDGSEIIADFIIACLEGNGKSWADAYKDKHYK